MAMPDATYGAVEAGKQPEMTALGERLGRALCNIRDSNDRACDTLSRFCNEPPAPSGPSGAVVQTAEPPPGTLASLTMLAERIAHESSRYESVTAKLRGIL